MWRVIFDRARHGAENMAIDQAILEAVAQREVPPTLRLYAWERPCLSLGYNQRIAEVDLDALEMRQWEIVRRITGGKAILHTDEITYSVALPDNMPLVEGSIIESYRRLSVALLAALELLGAHADVTSPDAAGRAQGPVCFEVPSNYEITAYGRKLVGSAQVRRFGGVLQHGTLPLIGDITRIIEVLRFEDEAERQWARQKVQERAITLEEALGQQVDWQVAAEAIAEGFRSTFSLILQETSLSEKEAERVRALIGEQYDNAEWTARR